MRNVEECVFQFMNIRLMSSSRTSVWELRKNKILPVRFCQLLWETWEIFG